MTVHSYTGLDQLGATLAIRAKASPRSIAAAVLGLIMSNPLFGHGEFCGKAPEAGFEQPPNQPRTGRYVNGLYGYSVAIPAPLNGYVSPNGAERGFGIVLSWTLRAYLRVDAAYDAFFDITATGVHRSDLSTIRLHDKVIDDQVAGYTLAQRPGGRFVTRVRCGEDPAVFIHDDVIVVLNREIYRLDLQTVPQRYDADVRVLNQMLRSWRWERLQPPAPRAADSSRDAAPPR
jgi:hypothetical protein